MFTNLAIVFRNFSETQTLIGLSCSYTNNFLKYLNFQELLRNLYLIPKIVGKPYFEAQKDLRNSQCHGPAFGRSVQLAPGTLLVDAAPIKAGRDSPLTRSCLFNKFRDMKREDW